MSYTEEEDDYSLGLKRSALDTPSESLGPITSGSSESLGPITSGETTEEYESSEEISDEKLDELIVRLKKFISDTKKKGKIEFNIDVIKDARDVVEWNWGDKFTKEEWEKFYIEIDNSLILYNMMIYTKNPTKLGVIEASELYQRYENFIKKDKNFLVDVKENILPSYIKAYNETHRPPPRYNLRKRDNTHRPPPRYNLRKRDNTHRPQPRYNLRKRTFGGGEVGGGEGEGKGKDKDNKRKKDGRSIKKRSKKSRNKKRSKKSRIKKSIKKRRISSLRNNRRSKK